MQETRATSSEQFFFGGWRKTVTWVLTSTFCLLALINLWAGGLLQVINAVAQLALASVFGWRVWRGSRFPVISVSQDTIEWGSPQSRKRKNIPIRDVLEFLPPVGKALTPLGLRTRSTGTLWVSLYELSAADRLKVRTAIEAHLKSGQGTS